MEMKEALGGGKGSHLNEEMVGGWSKQLLPFRNQTGGESMQETFKALALGPFSCFPGLLN